MSKSASLRLNKHGVFEKESSGPPARNPMEQVGFVDGGKELSIKDLIELRRNPEFCKAMEVARNAQNEGLKLPKNHPYLAEVVIANKKADYERNQVVMDNINRVNKLKQADQKKLLKGEL